MKKSILSLSLLMASAALIQAKGPSDPVLMTINGRPVTLSEFEYLYHKNNSQQVAPQTIDEYLEMFVTYKQKVADALSEKIDETEAFKNEFDGYRRDLSEPYMRSQEVEDSIVNAVYERMKTEVDVSHIMLANHGQGNEPEVQRERLDSIRTAILNGTADFADMARRFSIDRSASRNGGRMGFITPGRFPASFEDVAYTTPVGTISEVFATPFGWHIVKVNGTRPAQGMVLAEHILKLTQGLSDEEAAHKKAQIDSIYTLVTNGGDFEAIAMAESDDPGSKRNGGKLNWFGTGQMVPEFEAACFALKNGEISEPIKTSYGYHVIKRLDWKGLDPIDKVAPQIKQAIANDDRGRLARTRKLEQLYGKFKASINEQNLAATKEQIEAVGALDSALVANFLTSDRTMATVNGKKIPLSEIAYDLPQKPQGSVADQCALLEQRTREALNNAVYDAEREALATENADYRNLINEYRDGMLLFEVSDRKVWSKAKKDKEGLEKYFNEHRANYKWDAPKYKAYVVFATSDSIMNEAQKLLNSRQIAPDSLALELRKEFGKDVKIEKVIAAKGENNITDYLGFGAEKPEAKGRWKYYFPYKGRVVEAPEEVSDVRGAVTGDYQNQLEQEWIASLKKQYPAKINKKVLKKAK